jgi:hypothetical protein
MHPRRQHRLRQNNHTLAGTALVAALRVVSLCVVSLLAADPD